MVLICRICRLVLHAILTVHKTVVNLNRSLFDGARVTMLRNGLDKIVDKRDGFLFPIERQYLVSCIWRTG